MKVLDATHSGYSLYDPAVDGCRKPATSWRSSGCLRFGLHCWLVVNGYNLSCTRGFCFCWEKEAAEKRAVVAEAEKKAEEASVPNLDETSFTPVLDRTCSYCCCFSFGVDVPRAPHERLVPD